MYYFLETSIMKGPEFSTTILSAPKNHEHCLVSRVYVWNNLGRLGHRVRKRYATRDEKACQQIPEYKTTLLDLPFVQIKSQSTGEIFRLLIKQKNRAI